jgi:hypothetical protein
MKQTRRILAAAASFAIVAVGLMIWSLFDPRPVPVIVAMSIGQALGTCSLMAFVYVVVADWRAQTARLKKVDPSFGLSQPPSAPEKAP